VRILALDHGLARCGCAISDPTGTVVRPLPVIEPPDPRDVARLVSEHDVEVVVVGLPIGLAGGSGAQAAAARQFRDEVALLVDVPVETYDERLTTRLAERTARAGASAAEDSLAAAHLLESYLQRREAASGADSPETPEDSE
jgi:putative Holliday junction resolvase